MNHYLVDTNHLSPLVTLQHPLRQKFLERLEMGHDFSLSVPILTEMLFGISLLPRSSQNLAEWDRIKSNLTCYINDVVDAEKAAKLQVSLRRRGWQLETVDALIAVTAIRYNLILLTTDKDFSAVPGLEHENWLANKAVD